jgi:hypothetical protein
MMVVGMIGIGWFVAVPQPKVIVSGDPVSGKYSVQAAPGLGYSYRWDSNADGTFDSEEFGAASRLTLDLEEGASRDVRLEVKNAFGRTRSGVYQVSRPKRDGTTAQLGPARASDSLSAAPARHGLAATALSSIRGIQ